MDEREESSLAAALAAVPAPRQARGKRHAWPLVLVLIGAALVRGQRKVRAIGPWVAARQAEVVALLRPPRGRLPRTPTLRRALRAVAVAAWAQRRAAGTARPPAGPPGPWVGQAVDGQAVRGAQRRGAQGPLVSLGRHADGAVRGQGGVADKRNALTAAPRLLAGRALTGTVTTMDALLPQRAIAAPIRRQGGHDLLAVTAHQPARSTASARRCTAPVLPLARDCAAATRRTAQGHGRLAQRTRARRAARNADRAWPDGGQVLRRTDRAVDLATGAVHRAVPDGLTSLPPQEATVAAVAALWRGHWRIEHGGHDPRAGSVGADAGQGHTGNAPHARAARRNGVRNLFRGQGWASVPDALRHDGADVPRALHLLGALPSGL